MERKGNQIKGTVYVKAQKQERAGHVQGKRKDTWSDSHVWKRQEEKVESGEVEAQSLLRQDKTHESYPKYNWKPLRGFKPHFKFSLQC